mmetsp:Transcript_103473/g.183811  ORF Transcript_103473/g.183811 Transcript_103473/m.183811 type:complete len:234 (-) Transcript_103473:449-1150(-)
MDFVLKGSSDADSGKKAGISSFVPSFPLELGVWVSSDCSLAFDGVPLELGVWVSSDCSLALDGVLAARQDGCKHVPCVRLQRLLEARTVSSLLGSAFSSGFSQWILVTTGSLDPDRDKKPSCSRCSRKPLNDLKELSFTSRLVPVGLQGRMYRVYRLLPFIGVGRSPALCFRASKKVSRSKLSISSCAFDSSAGSASTDASAGSVSPGALAGSVSPGAAPMDVMLFSCLGHAS